MPDDPHLFVFDLDLGIRTQLTQKLESSPLQKLTKSVGANSTVTVLKDPAGGGLGAIGGGWRVRNRCGLSRFAAEPA